MQAKRVKTKETTTARTDFDDVVVSSQYEPYEEDDNDDDDDDDDDADRELAAMSGHCRLQSQTSTPGDDDNDDYDDDDDDWRHSHDNITVPSQQTPPPWTGAATPRGRRKRKPSSTRRYCANFDRMNQSSYVDRNMNKVICRGEFGAAVASYQMPVPDLPPGSLGHDSPAGYYAGEQMGGRNPHAQNEGRLGEHATEVQSHTDVKRFLTFFLSLNKKNALRRFF